VEDANTIQIRTLPVCIYAKNGSFGASHWAAESLGIGQDKGGLTTQWIDIKVRERVWEIAQSMSIITKQDAGRQPGDLQLDCRVTRICDLVAKRPLYNRYMAGKNDFDGQKLNPALDVFVEVGLH